MLSLKDSLHHHKIVWMAENVQILRPRAYLTDFPTACYHAVQHYCHHHHHRHHHCHHHYHHFHHLGVYCQARSNPSSTCAANLSLECDWGSDCTLSNWLIAHQTIIMMMMVMMKIMVAMTMMMNDEGRVMIIAKMRIRILLYFMWFRNSSQPVKRKEIVCGFCPGIVANFTVWHHRCRIPLVWLEGWLPLLHCRWLKLWFLFRHCNQ